MKKRFVAMLLALIMVLGLLPVSAMAANDTMSWSWTVSMIGGYFFRSDGSQTNTYRYTINRHLDNTKDNDIGYKFEWNASAGGNTYNGGWQLCMTVNGEIVERTTAYVFNRDMTNASGTWTAPGSSHGGNSTHPFTLYFSSFAKADNEKNPPTEDDFDDRVLPTIVVKTECKSEEEHPLWAQELIRGTFSKRLYNKNTDSNGKDVMVVTLTRTADYVSAYNTMYGGEHSIDGTVSTTVSYEWNRTTKQWTKQGDLYIPLKCESVQPPEVTPDNPVPDKTYGALDNAAVTVNCSTVPSHSKMYAMNEFTSTTPVKEGDTYTSKITVSYDDYDDDFQNPAHTLTSVSPVEIEVKWDGEKWVKKDDSGKVRAEFTVKCEDECPEFDPTDLGDSAVKVVCQNPKKTSEHLEQTYALLEGSYTVMKPTTNKDDNIWTGGTITIKAQKYVEEYNKTYIGHTPVAPDEYTFDLVYDGNNGWQIVEQGEPLAAPYAEFKAVCSDCPNPDESNTNPTSVRVQCVNPLGGHLWEDFRIKAGSYTFTAPITTDNTSGATTCTIRVYPQKYLDAYLYHDSFNHSAQESYLDIPLTWNGAKWLTNKPDGTYVFHVVCTWTLSFDSNGGTAVPSQTVWHNYSGTKPAPDPTRTGYTFTGWYVDPACTTLYDFDTVLTADRTVYAGWSWNYYPIYRPVKATPKFNTTDHFAYVQGYPNGSVKPTGNITRAETAAILFRLMDEGTRNTYYSTKSGFRDVSSNNWFNTYVATLNAAGVITDSANGYFRPNDAITRAELAAMLAQFADTKGAANYFNDVSANHWAANAIAVCVKLGWINGYPDGSFRPDNYITRAELMAMINRATGRTPKTADAFLNGMKTWTDNLDTTKWYYVDVQEATNSHDYIGALNEKWTALRSAPNWSVYE